MRNRPLRGFESLIGEIIVKIDAECINVVRVRCASGKVVALSCDEQHYGIGILQAEEEKK